MTMPHTNTPVGTLAYCATHHLHFRTATCRECDEARCQEDAARYQWLSAQAQQDAEGWYFFTGILPFPAMSFDAAVDAARSREAPLGAPAPHAALLTALHAVTPETVARLSTGQCALVRELLRSYGLMEKEEDTHA